MSVNTRLISRLVAVLTALVFFLSAILNFGAKIPLGSTELSFSNPLTSIGGFEVLIGISLVAAALISRLYIYGAAYLLAIVGITEGLLSPEVQGLARSLHVVMSPPAIVGVVLLGLEAGRVYNSRAKQKESNTNRETIIILQFFVAGLVTLGGAAYAATGTYHSGTILGLIHLAVGFVGFYAGYAFLKRKVEPRRFLIAINIVTIAYSAFSESIAQIYSLLAPGINDSLIGTIIAMFVSAAIICLMIIRPKSVTQEANDGNLNL